jgi:lipoyl(octanoyl) transferase
VSLVREDLGRMDYLVAWELQKRRVEQRLAGEIPDTALVVEHPPVYTLGRSRGAADNVLAPGDVPVVQVERGGNVTWHGPGQVVIYPIVLLPEARRDIHAYLRSLEEAAIRACRDYGLEAGRDPRNTGAWVGGRKICSIGVAVRRWATWHGMALNVAPDLSYFQRINPCGFGAEIMTSMAAELGEAPPQPEVTDRLFEHLRSVIDTATPRRIG